MLNKLIAMVALMLSLVAAPALAEDSAKIVRSINVTGQGEVSATPDMGLVTMGVVSAGATSREALDANSKAMAGLIAMLKEVGLASRDIATSNFSVGPRYDYGQNNNQPPKVVGYEVTNTVTAHVRKLENLGEILDKAVSAGSNQIHGVSFSVSEPDKALDEARKRAIADARRKAEVYAAAGGFTLGKVVTLSEAGGYQAPSPMVMKSMRADAASAVPMEQGEQRLSVDVNIVWEIK